MISRLNDLWENPYFKGETSGARCEHFYSGDIRRQRLCGTPIDPVSNFLIRIACSTWLSQDILFADYNHEQTTKALPFRSHLINCICSGVVWLVPGMRRDGQRRRGTQ